MAQLAVFAVQAIGALNEGAQKRKVLYEQAQALRDSSMRGMAAMQADVSEAGREKERMYSRGLAVAAASGAGVDDAGVVNLLGDLNAEGEYRILSKLYVGSSEAQGLQYQSEQAMRAGDSALNAGYLKFATTVLSEYGNFGSMWGGAKTTFGKIASKFSRAPSLSSGGGSGAPSMGGGYA